ncbi:MAG: hypothetical protein ACE5HS_03255 [bacterium]
MFRKFLITTTIGLLFFAFIAYNGWHLLKINTGIKHALIAKLKQTFGEECSVEELSLGLGSVNLKRVKLAFHNSPYEVLVEELRLGYSLQSLLKGRGELEKTAEEITLYRPLFTLLYNPEKHSETNVDLSLQLTSETEKLYRAIIKEYDFIKKITISEGEIDIFNSNSEENIRIAKQINGWAYTDDNHKVWLRLAGHIFESDEYNMVLYGQMDLNRGGVDFINVDLHDYKLTNAIHFLIPDYFDVLDGKVNGHLIVTERLTPTRGFNIEGNISLSNGQLKLNSKNTRIDIDNITIDAEVKDWNLEIKNASQIVNGSPTTLSGKIMNLIDPRFDLRLASQRLDIDQFLTRFLNKRPFQFSGISRLNLSISEAMSAPKIAGSLNADSVWFYDKNINDITVDVNFANSKLNFPLISGNVDSAKFTGLGNIDFNSADKLIDFKLNITGDFTNDLHKIGLSSADSCYGESEIIVLGPLSAPVSRGNFGLTFVRHKAPSLALQGTFIYNQQRLALNAGSDDGEFHLTISADDVFNSPQFSLQATKFEKLFIFVNNPILNFIRKRYSLNLFAENSSSNPFFAIDGYRQDNYENLFHIETDTLSKHSENWVLGDILLYPNSEKNIKGEFELVYSGKEVQLKNLYLGQWLKGNLNISKNNYTPRNGRLAISGLDLSLLFDLLGGEAEKYEGNLYGRINVNDDSGSTQYLGNFWLMDGFIRKVGPYKSELDFVADNNNIIIKKLSVDRAESANILAEGHYDFESKKIKGTVAGTNLDVSQIVKILTGSEGHVRGKAMVQISFDGILPEVPIFGDIQIHNAGILMFDFDEIIWDFGTSNQPNGSFFSRNVLNIGHTVFTRDGAFRMEGSGQLPLRNQPLLNVEMSGDGNFLVLLSDMQKFFEETRSNGHLDLRLSGHYKTPNFSGSKLTLNNGALKLTSVINRVENLAADLEVLPDDYLLHIKTLKGTIKGESVSITNTNVMEGLNHGVYEPLRIGGNDLNLGALIIQTSRRGIPLNIPGLMETGEIGWYSFSGRSPGEQFFIAGPWLRPNIRGEIRVQDANLMFPFDEGANDGNEIVLNILNNINWDVRALSSKDTRYVKEFTTGIYVNMDIDNDNSWLEFNGILKDSTFKIAGKVQSTRGEFEYIDLNFRVEKFGAEFNQTSLFPIVSGKAWTVVRDSANVPSDVYLTLYSVDDVTNQEVKKGRWDRLNIKLSSEFPGYNETQGEIMAALGYSSETVDEKAKKAVGYSTDKLIFRPLMRPLERELERKLGLDVVRFSYAITRNFLDANFNNEELSSSLALLRSSRLVLGKYLTDDIYFLYSGELKAGIDYQFQDKGVGLQHILGLEYRLNSGLLLQMEYDYNSLLETRKDDKKIWLRHSFPF